MNKINKVETTNDFILRAPKYEPFQHKLTAFISRTREVLHGHAHAVFQTRPRQLAERGVDRAGVEGGRDRQDGAVHGDAERPARVRPPKRL